MDKCERDQNIRFGNIADNVYANHIYDLRLDVYPLDFFKMKFEKDRGQEIALSNAIYKYNK